jgi:hypothetical protein
MRRPTRQLVHKLLFALSVVAAGVVSLTSSTAWGQRGSVHYFHSSDMPPGAIGRGQLLRGGPAPGHFQPVEITAPQGVLISPAVKGQFVEPRPDVLRAGMLLGETYRFRISNIPEHETEEVYPTVEVISRLHPPPGQETRFPIPIQLTREDLLLAASGRYVVRVIYLEDPATALPVAQTKGQQQLLDVPGGQDALRMADELGRPVAILRMGSRVPDFQRETTNLGFSYGEPPMLFYEKQTTVPRDAGLEELPRDARNSRHYRRVPVTR